MNTDRYIRQVSVREFGAEAQEKLQKSKILVIGAGALGCPVLMYLTAAGVGTIGVLDSDEVNLSNLHRQVLYTEKNIDEPKALAASKRLSEMNSTVKVIPHFTHLHKDNALSLISQYDLVIECSDNFPTKFLVNDACVMLGKPFIIGGVLKFSGQLSVYNYNGGPTYRCLIEEEPDPLEAPTCSEAGVIGMVPGIIGTMQALEALKVLTKVGKVLSGRLLNFNGLTMEFTEFAVELNPKNLEITELSDYEYSCPNSLFEGRELTGKEFLEIVNSSVKPRVIALADDGKPLEYKTYSWPTIPLYELPNLTVNLSCDEQIVLICMHGFKSLAAMRYLFSKKGFKKIFHLKDGLSTLSIE
jgi:adenylyltransferase/sulfurtransferase